VTEDAVRNGSVRLFGKNHDVADQVRDARRQLVERLHAETQRQLGRGAELERILFVGGGAVALADDIRDWFPNQAIAPHPAFANARGMLKYLRYVCQEPA
jgi:plasmid segregation protein ParM